MTHLYAFLPMASVFAGTGTEIFWGKKSRNVRLINKSPSDSGELTKERRISVFTSSLVVH